MWLAGAKDRCDDIHGLISDRIEAVPEQPSTWPTTFGNRGPHFGAPCGLASSDAPVGGFVLTAQRLKDRIKEKAGGRCDIAGIPYAVVAGIHDWPDEEEILAGLSGLTCPEGRDSSGLFCTDGERPCGRYRRLPGRVTEIRHRRGTTALRTSLTRHRRRILPR
jgi:hypothetical protein